MGTIAELDANTFDLTWAIDVRASLLRVRAFAEQYRPHPDGGRMGLFTSEQHRGPLPTEISYAATKGALQQITATLADALAERGITVNCVNPGSTDTGWATRSRTRSLSVTCPGGGGTPRPKPPAARAPALPGCRDYHRPVYRRRGRISALYALTTSTRTQRPEEATAVRPRVRPAQEIVGFLWKLRGGLEGCTARRGR